jgi:hypothetical protein
MKAFGGNIKINTMKTNIFILLLFFLLLSSCDPYWFNIVVDDNGFKKNIDFECGKIDVSGNVLADRQMSAFLRFKLDSPIVINPEKLEMWYRGEKVIYYRIYLNGSHLEGIKTINTDSDIRIIINSIVQSGDTIKINIDNFILCKEQPLGIKNINLIIVRK